MDIFGELLYLLTSRKNQIVVLSKFKIGMLTREIVNVAGKGLTAGDIAQAMAGPAMAIAIGYALKAPAMVLFTLPPVGYAANAMGGAGGPFAVYLVAIFASEMEKAVSQGLGTSMLQMGNILKNPRVWIPPILTSMITGPVATCIFRLEMNGAAVNSGMGTCGLCGPIGVWTGWTDPGAFDWTGLLLVSFVLPAVICLLIALAFRKMGWIRPGDLSI